MEDNTNIIDTLLEKATDYGKTSYELAKLKAIDKSTDVVSSLLPHYIVFVIMGSTVLFIGLGLAFWLGEILGKIYFGFFAVAAFFCLTGAVIHFWLHNWVKALIRNGIIKQVLK